MKHENSLTLPSPFEFVQYQFATWHESKKTPREPIPEYLWKAASKLQNKYPISRISKALRLNQTDLKNRISGQKSNHLKKKPSSPLFVELDCLQSFTVSECIVEMIDAGGSKRKQSVKLDYVSIHAPAWGATDDKPYWQKRLLFQSTPPHGGRHRFKP